MKKNLSLQSIARQELATIKGGGAAVSMRICPPTSCYSATICDYYGGMSCKCLYTPTNKWTCTPS